ncbi:hypothetical protein BB560_002813 [Smittium megazygosporum]|uniref:FCP1 homology domain-containing protein n=1 Tax=Smittium megazygosporum TaxID=133381 RepID=A0A2T9ZDR7_9FUNG|nr:hypothetical protein BB560_002813 [Smittium megazygosporum]
MPSTNYKPSVACIFDVDGTILDTESLYTEAINAVLKDYDLVMSNETKLKMMGRDTKSATEILIKDTNLPLSVKEFNDKVDVIKVEIFKKAEIIEGADKLIRHLSKHNIPISIATSSARRFFEIKKSNHQELFSLFGDHVTCGDDPSILRLKPHPDIYLAAKEKLGIPHLKNSQYIVFEDAVSGVLSGVNAEMKVVWIPDERFFNLSDIPEHGHGAYQILNSIKEFEPEKYGLPPFDS